LKGPRIAGPVSSSATRRCWSPSASGSTSAFEQFSCLGLNSCCQGRSLRQVYRAMIERSFDISFVADLALREKQIQQNYRPIIAVHKWFARRPGTLFRSLLLAEFANAPLRETFYRGHCLRFVSELPGGGGSPSSRQRFRMLELRGALRNEVSRRARAVP